MTDKEYREQKKRVRKLFDRWMKPVGMGWFHVEFEWGRALNEDQPREVMKTEVTWEYREVTFIVRLPACVALSDERLEHIVVHELSHALTGGFMAQLDLSNDAINQIMETTTENVANALLWAREAGKKDT